MRTTFTNDHVQRCDDTCDGSCPRGQSDQGHQHKNGESLASAESNESLARVSPLEADETASSQRAHSDSRISKLTMSVSEAADWIGISRAFAYELVARGEIPSIRLGRRVLVPTKRLYAFVLNEA